VPATVLQLSDTHLAAAAGPTAGGRDPDARLAVVLDAWRRRNEHADLIVVSGDDADDGSPAALDRLAAALRPLGAPVLALPGNHDTAGAVREAFPGPPQVEVGAWRVVGCDTSRPGQVHGTVDVAALAARLDSLDERPTVVALHHPPRSRSSHPWFALEGADDLLGALAARRHVRAVVSGHLHDPFELAGPGGLALLGAPSTLVPIAHDGDRYRTGEGGPTGARVLRLADDGRLATEIVAA
jgi:Icc protein